MPANYARRLWSDRKQAIVAAWEKENDRRCHSFRRSDQARLIDLARRQEGALPFIGDSYPTFTRSRGGRIRIEPKYSIYLYKANKTVVRASIDEIGAEPVIAELHTVNRDWLLQFASPARTITLGLKCHLDPTFEAAYNGGTIR